jgi:tellurite resistance protein TerC
MVTERESVVIPQHNPLVRWFSSHFPVLDDFRGNHFFVKEEVRGKLQWAATPLFLALVCIEFTDLIFALDSIPAIFAITEDPFIIYTSNVFAILGLRSMYFLLAHAITQFKFLKHGVALVLAFVGLKMLTKDVFEISMVHSLIFILCVITLSIGLSLVKRRLERDKEA